MSYLATLKNPLKILDSDPEMDDFQNLTEMSAYVLIHSIFIQIVTEI